MLWPEVLTFVRASLPEPPARVLEIGAGDGMLAAVLRDGGYDVVAIDPCDEPAPGVLGVALVDVDEPHESFDAAIAVVALHHVEPLADSIAHLAALLRRDAVLVVDEFDVAALDDRAMAWWSAQQRAAGNDIEDPDAVRLELQGHLHDVPTLRAALAEHFEVGLSVRGTYLHRWHLPPGLRAVEEDLVGQGLLPAAGVRFLCRLRR